MSYPRLALIPLTALVLAGCSPGAPAPTGTPSAPAPTPPISTAAPSPSPTPTAVTSALVEVPDLVLVDWPPGRSEIDGAVHFHYRPGPYGGESFDEDAAFEAVAAMNLSGSTSPYRAVVHTMQGDYVSELLALQEAALDAGTGEGPDATVSERAPVVTRSHFAIILDASGSMAADNQGQTRMAAAKAAIDGFVAELPAGSTVSLRVYGHEGDNSEAARVASCASSEMLFRGQVGEPGFSDALAEVGPVGWTPLAKAIDDAAADLPADASDSVVYVLTDGIETCGGDPVAAAGRLRAAGHRPIINVIGFELGDADQAAQRAVAEAGGGEFTAVDSADALRDYFEAERERFRDALDEWERLERDRIEEVLAAQTGDLEKRRAQLRSSFRSDTDNMRTVIDRLLAEGVISGNDAMFARQDLDARELGAESVLSTLNFETGDKHEAELERAVAEVYETSSQRWTEIYGES